MRNPLAVLVAVVGLSLSASAGTPGESSFDWTLWRYLPVQDGGRYKPLDTLASETLRTLGGGSSFTDPQTGRTLGPTALYLSMLLEREDAGELPAVHGSMMMGHAPIRDPDKWDSAPLLRVKDRQLRAELGMPAGEKYISPLELSRAKVPDPQTGGETSFLLWAEKFRRKSPRSLSPVERAGADLAEAFREYREHRAGRGLAVVPIPQAKHQEWTSLAELLEARLDDSSDPGGRFRKVRDQFLKVRTAYRDGSPEAFNEASAAFLATVAEIGPQLGTYPKEDKIRLEVAYNHWVPFRFAWVLTLVSVPLVLLSWPLVRWKRELSGRLLYAAGIGAYLLGMAAAAVGFWMRVAISGRAPVTNMYESVVFMAAGTMVFGLAAELIVRKRFLLVAAAAISAFALVVADICSGVLDPSLRPLQPVLRHNLWLVVHVMVIMLGYAAFALSLGIGNFTLGYCMLPPRDRPLLGMLTRLNYKVLQVGVLLLVIGTILGGWWADYSWGRFWGWDPKEVWALITLLGYLAFLHARYLGWVKDRGLAAWSVLCFALVVMAWYGVNFVLQSGLHAYAFGGGGQLYVLAALLAQFLYVFAALLVSYLQDLTAGPGPEPVRAPRAAARPSRR